MSKNIIQKVVVGAIVVHKNKILLLQRALNEESFPGLWELPSGRREDFESSVQAVKREVKEETGLNVEVVAPMNTFEYVIEKKDIIKDTTQINFLVKIKGKPGVKITKEHDNFAWVNKRNLLNYKISKEIKKALKDL